MTEKTCERCGHPFDPHVLIATTNRALDGGVILCPVPGCECYATWGINGAPAKRVPDQAETAELREYAQKGGTSRDIEH